MSIQSIFATPQSLFSRTDETSSPLSANQTSSEVSLPLTEEIETLENRFAEEFNLDDDEDTSSVSERSVFNFVAEQLESDDNSDQAVAFLLNLLDEASTTNRSQSDFQSLVNGETVGQSNEPQSLTEVLDLAVDTFRILSNSDASIGLRLSVLSEQLEGLQELSA